MKKQILNTDSYSPLYKQLMQKLPAIFRTAFIPSTAVSLPSRSCATPIRSAA